MVHNSRHRKCSSALGDILRTSIRDFHKIMDKSVSLRLGEKDAKGLIKFSVLVCTIITCEWGLVFYLEFAVRQWRLIYQWPDTKPLETSCAENREITNDRGSCTPVITPERRVSLPTRCYHDASHLIILIILIITLAELIVSTATTHPDVKLLAMIHPSMLFVICLPQFFLDIAHYMRLRAPFRISSVAKGEPVRPGIYTLIEDIVAVDMGGRSEFRSHINDN